MSDTQDELPDTIDIFFDTKNSMLDAQDKLPVKKDTDSELLSTIESHSVSKFELISLFLKHDSFGTHYVICKRLRNMRIDDVIPQLVSIMLRQNFSYAIYALLLHWATRSIQFRILLFYNIRAILARKDENTASHCYRLCHDLFNIDCAVARKNMGILRVNYMLGKSYRERAAKKSCGYLANSYVRGNKSTVAHNCVLDNNAANNNRYVRINRTRSVFCEKSVMPAFEGLIFYFVTSVASVISSGIYESLDRAARILVNRKNDGSLVIRKNSRFAFHRSVDFYDSLVEISNILKTIPSALRQRILEAELEIVNLNMKNILSMFDPGRKIVAIVVKECAILDSAENVPFRVVVETVDRGVCVDQRTNSYFQKIDMLRSHLHSVNELYCGNDVNNIRENILDAIEKIIHKTKRKVDVERVRIKNLDAKNDECLKNIKCEDKKAEAALISMEEAREGKRTQEEVQGYNGIREDKGVGNNLLEESINKIEEDVNELQGIKNELKNGKCNVEFYFEETNGALENNDVSEANEALENNIESQSQLTRSITEINKKYALNFLIDNLKINQWQTLVDNIFRYSNFSSLPHWGLFSFIVKSGSVLKQEYLAYQLLTQFKSIFDIENTGIYLRNYRIYLVSDTAGLVETVVDAYSIHNIKYQHASISAFFAKTYIDQALAKRNFLYSLVGYSLLSYLLQLKDRHNGNILIDSCGNIVHVDFGFMLGTHPGFYCMENAPFKFSHEYFDIIDIKDFRILFLAGFKAVRKHHRCFNHIMESIETSGYCSQGATSAVLARLVLHLSDKELESHCKGLIDRSINNIRTAVYDKFQYYSNGYL